MERLVVHLQRTLAWEGTVPRQHLEDHRAKRKQIGTRIGRLSLELFRRHVGRRTHNHPRLGQLCLGALLR